MRSRGWSLSIVRGDASKRGFTLLEVLIALAILSLALGALYQGYALSLRQETFAEREAAAAALAQSLLARVGADLPAEPGQTTGTTEGMSWAVTLTTGAARGQSSVQPIDVLVTVAWPERDGQVVELRSTRLVSAVAP